MKVYQKDNQIKSLNRIVIINDGLQREHLKTEDDLTAYDYTVGYSEKIKFLI